MKVSGVFLMRDTLKCTLKRDFLVGRLYKKRGIVFWGGKEERMEAKFTPVNSFLFFYSVNHSMKMHITFRKSPETFI